MEVLPGNRPVRKKQHTLNRLTLPRPCALLVMAGVAASLCTAASTAMRKAPTADQKCV
jgi:hypothetical protein